MRTPTFQQKVAKMLIIDKIDEGEVIEKLEAEGIAPGKARDAVRKVKYALKRKEREKILGTPRVKSQVEEDEEGLGSFLLIVNALAGLGLVAFGLFTIFESKGDVLPFFAILAGIWRIVVGLGSPHWN